MRIAILAPATIQDYAPLLYEEYRKNLPKGMICNWLTDMVRQYIDLGHEVVLCTLDSEIDQTQIYYGARLTIFVGKNRMNPYAKAFSMFRDEIKQMTDFLMNNCTPCDIYNAHWTYEFALAALNVCPERTIVNIRDWPWVVLRYNTNFYRFMRLLMAKRVFKKCNYYIANSEYVQELMLKRYPKKNIVVIPNSIDIKKCNEQEKKLHSEKHQIISINNGFFGRKNGKTLLRAFAIIRERDRMAEMHLYGTECEKEGGAYRWAVENNLLEGVVFHGKVSHDEIMKALREADLLIHPSFEETFGNTLIEAMISKTPVIGGNASGAVPWVLGGGKYGELVDVSDEEAIASKSYELLNDVHKWKNIMQTAYQYAVNNFYVGNMIRKYLEAYEWRLYYDKR